MQSKVKELREFLSWLDQIKESLNIEEQFTFYKMLNELYQETVNELFFDE